MNNIDYTEFEAKFYPVERHEYRKKLQEIGAKLVVPERKMRRAIAHHHNNPQIKATYLRVRDEGGIIRLSLKTHAMEEGSLSDQKEIDVEVSDYEKTVKLFESLGFNFDTYQETLRETWELEGAEIVIDTWPGLLTYSEIEASSEEHVKEVALKLGLNWDKKIITSALEIFMKVYHLTEKEALKKTTQITFEQNPFENLKPDNSWI